MKTISNIWIVVAATLVTAFIGICRGCDPPDCAAASPGDLVVDPEDCHKFYVCLMGGAYSDASFPCADGEFFNATLQDCSAEEKPCSNECLGGGNCTLTCSENLQFINDPIDCSKFYICLPGDQLLEYTCPTNTPYFDGTNCTTDEEVCCSACEPLCTGAGVQVPDPFDCRSFYACQNTGIPDDTLHAMCPNGQIFNPSSGVCEDGDTCTAICEGGSTPSGGTTPVGPGSTTMAIATTTNGNGGGSSNGVTTPVGGTTDAYGCVSTYSCTAVGHFPKCTSCQPEFFDCKSANGAAVVETCSGNLVFNPNPDYPYCILPENCPYH